MKHEIRTWRPQMMRIWRGEQKHLVMLANASEYRQGDFVRLRETDDHGLTGREMTLRIGYVSRPDDPGSVLPEDMVVFSVDVQMRERGRMAVKPRDEANFGLAES